MSELFHAREVSQYDEALRAQYDDQTLPPNVLLSERLMLGALLWHGPSVVRALIPADFYSEWHRNLFNLVLALYERYPHIDYLDPVAVKDEMFRLNLHHRCTDMVFMYDEAISFGVNVIACRYHAERILDTAEARVVQQLGKALASTSDIGVAQQRMADMQTEVDSIRARRGDWDAMDSSRLDERVREARLRFATETPPAIPTGLEDLDRMLNGGFRPGTFNVVGARPGVGKSLLAGTVAVHVGSLMAHRVLYMTLELTAAEITNRMLANVGGIELTRLQNPEQLTVDDHHRMTEAQERIADWPIHIEDGGKTIEQIEDLSRSYFATAPSGLLIVDFLGRIREDGKQQSRERHVALCASRLTDLAKELMVPVICVVSFSRESVRRGGQPRMDDIRDSGNVESDADTVTLMWHGNDQDHNQVDVVIDKNRYGTEGTLQLAKQGHRGRVASMARFSAPRWAA